MTKLEHLFKSNYKALCLYATHIVGDIDTAEDIVMDCFLMLAEQPERDERILSMKNYIYRMVRNACINHLGTKVSITDPQHIPDVPDDKMISANGASGKPACGKKSTACPGHVGTYS